MQRINNSSVTKQELINDLKLNKEDIDVLFQGETKLSTAIALSASGLNTKTGKELTQEVTEAQDEVKRQSIYDKINTFRLGAMLSNISTLTTAVVGNLTNLAVVYPSTMLKYKGVDNVVGSDIDTQVDNIIKEEWDNSGTLTYMNEVTPASKLAWDGTVLGTAAKLGEVAINFTCSLPDAVIRNWVTKRVRNLEASKMAQQAYPNDPVTAKAKAEEWVLDSMNLEPQTLEGAKLRGVVQDAGRAVSVMPPKSELDNKKIEEVWEEFGKATLAEKWTIGKDQLIPKASNEAIRKLSEMVTRSPGAARFLQSALVPFSQFANMSARLGLDASVGSFRALIEVGTGATQAIKEGNSQAFINSLKNLSVEAKYGLSKNVLGLATALMIASLIDDEEFMPDYDSATTQQRRLALASGIPFNSVNIGGFWVSLDLFPGIGGVISSSIKARQYEGVFNIVGTYVLDSAKNYFKGLPAGQKALDISKIEGDDITLNNLGEQLAGYVATYIPNIITQANKAVQGDLKQTEYGDWLRPLKQKVHMGDSKYSAVTGTDENPRGALATMMFGSRLGQDSDLLDALAGFIDIGGKLPITPLNSRTKWFNKLGKREQVRVNMVLAQEMNQKIEELALTMATVDEGDIDTIDSLNKQLSRHRSKVLKDIKSSLGED